VVRLFREHDALLRWARTDGREERGVLGLVVFRHHVIAVAAELV
jgi:hypothetical protein